MQDEESDKAGTVCAVSGFSIIAHGVGGEDVSRGSRGCDDRHAAKTVKYAIA
jgi:hypothetical protein